MSTPIAQNLKEFLEYLEIERGRSARTLENYAYYLRRFVDWAKITTTSQISAEIIRRFRLHLNRTLSGRGTETLNRSTQNYHLIALRSFLKYLAKRDIKTLAPEKIELAKQSARQVQFLEPDELARIRALPATDPSIIGYRDRAILELLFSTGLRVSEAVNLKIDQINLKRNEFSVLGKGNKQRLVFLSPVALLALGNYLKKRPVLSEFLFVRHDRAKNSPHAHTAPLTARSVQRIVDAYARAAGVVKAVTPHTLRHTYATDLLRNGADIRSVQALLGHESILTTQVYTHITDRHLKQIYDDFHDKSKPTKNTNKKT